MAPERILLKLTQVFLNSISLRSISENSQRSLRSDSKISQIGGILRILEIFVSLKYFKDTNASELEESKSKNQFALENRISKSRTFWGTRKFKDTFSYHRGTGFSQGPKMSQKSHFSAEKIAPKRIYTVRKQKTKT